jgi:hypothetical protein
LKHENLVRLRGFCCSKGRGECFLIYDFVPNGNLVQYLDVKDGSGKVLEWSTRISIINGIAKGQCIFLLVEVSVAVFLFSCFLHFISMLA